MGTADEEGIAALTKAVPDISRDDAEVLLYGYAASGQPDLIKILLEAGVSVNAQRAKDGCTALHIAHFRKNSDVVALLEAHGADATLCNVWGETVCKLGTIHAGASLSTVASTPATSRGQF